MGGLQRSEAAAPCSNRQRVQDGAVGCKRPWRGRVRCEAWISSAAVDGGGIAEARRRKRADKGASERQARVRRSQRAGTCLVSRLGRGSPQPAIPELDVTMALIRRASKACWPWMALEVARRGPGLDLHMRAATRDGGRGGRRIGPSPGGLACHRSTGRAARSRPLELPWASSGGVSSSWQLASGSLRVAEQPGSPQDVLMVQST